MNPTWVDLCRVDPLAAKREHDAVLDAFRKRLFRQPSFLQLNFLAWCGVAFVLFWMRFVLYQDPARALGVTLVADGLGFFLSLGLRHFYRKMEIPFPRNPRLVLRVALICLVCAVFDAECVQVFVDFMNWEAVKRPHAQRLLAFSVLRWMLYMSWSLGYFWVKAEMYARRKRLHAAMAKSDAMKSELQLLRFQLDPHFLFNTLNGIANEIPANPAAAVRMVDELSDYLRHSLDHRSHLLLPLAEELDSTQAYLQIQTARFGEKLQTSITSTPAARHIPVPGFLLQPLVENAFKHGFDHAAPPWRLLVEAALHGERLTIEIRNNGKLATYADAADSGLGLELIRRRLAIHYPDRHRFRIHQVQDWVVATLELEGLPCCV